MKRTERLFALAEVLRGRRTGITAEALANRFEVSVRTIMRDLDALRSAALPINTERGRGGGVHLDKSYSMPPVSFTAREALVLLVLGRFAKEMRVVPFNDTLDAAVDKVRAALPRDTQRQLTRIEGSLRFVGVPALAAKEDVRRAVEQAWFEGSELDVVYFKADQTESSRRLKIDSVILERGETLLNCVDVRTDEKRQLKLHRILRATAPAAA